MKKNLFTFLLAMLISIAANAEVASGTCGTSVTWSLSDDYVLTISGTGAMTNYSYGSYSIWYNSYRSKIKSVEIESGVTSIGSYAFFGCSSLSSIKIPDGVTSIGDDAFYGCSSLSSITIPKSVTSIGTYAFYGCSSLSSITIPKSVTSIGTYAFQMCSNLTSLYITDIESWCKINYGNSSSHPFYYTGSGTLYINGEKASDIVIPNTITSIGTNKFEGFSNITSITIPKSVTSIGSDILKGCSSLVSVTIPFVGASATETSASSSTLFGYFFGTSSSTGLTSVSQYYSSGSYSTYYIPSSLRNVTVTGGKLFYGAFYGCNMLENINIDGVTSIDDYAFYKCSNIKSLSLCNSLQSIGNNAFYNCKQLSELTFPATLTSIGENALQNTTVLKSITMLGTTPPTLGASNAINNFSTIYVDGSAVEDYLADENWKAHKAQIISTSENTEYDVTVTAIANKSALHMEIGEDNLQKVVKLKVSGTINSYDLMLMRNKMVNLKYLDLSGATIVDNSYEYFNNDGNGYHSVANTLTRYALQPNLFSVKLPASLTAINDYALTELTHVENIEVPANVTTLGSYAASDLSFLKTFTFEENSMLNSIGNYAFQNCSSIKELSIPGSVKTMYSRSIDGCSSLNKFTLEDGTESLNLTGGSISDPLQEVYIGRNISTSYTTYYTYYSPFVTKSNLQKVTIGEGVTSIPNNCFYNSACNTVTLPSTLTSIGSNSFSGNKTTAIYITDLNAWSNVSGLSTLMSSSYDKDIYLNGEKIATLDLTGVETMQPYAFDRATITGVYIPTNSTLAEIPDYAFANTKIDKIQMPVSIKKIGDYAFNSCANLTEVKLPSSIKSIGNHAFDACPKLNDVYTYTIEPQQIDQYTYSTYKTATLHCPKTSYLDYFYHTQWSQFLKIVDFDEPYDYIFIDNDVTLGDKTGAINGNPDTDINPGGGLIVEDDLEQGLGDVHIKFNGTTNVGASIIGSKIHAHKIYLDIDVKANYWYYFCFPFEVDLKTIQKSGGYIFRYYDGQKRANGQSGWTDIAAGTEHLSAGEGYIFRTNDAGTLTICISKKTVESEGIDITNLDEFTNLNSYTAETADNKSWNFVGNKYLSYYDINDLQYGAPIVVLNSETNQYEALRPGDDEYVLHPCQAFFVQTPENVEKVGFEADSRITYLQSKNKEARTAKRRARAAKMNINSNRKLINLTITDGENTDKTRVVFNDKQKLTFEAECDAAKFDVAKDKIQMYSLDADNVKYSINERPVSDGKVQLAYSTPQKGEFTISTTRMDAHVFLEDAVTGTLHDLENGEYTFESEAGLFANRFTLVIANDEATAIKMLNSANNVEAESGAYDMNGRRVSDSQKGIVIKGNKKVLVK